MDHQTNHQKGADAVEFIEEGHRERLEQCGPFGYLELLVQTTEPVETERPSTPEPVDSEEEDDGEEIEQADDSDRVISGNGTTDKKKETQVELVLRHASSAQLLKTEGGKLYAAVQAKGRTEYLGIKTKAFELWLTREFYMEHRRPPSREALQSAIGLLEAKAMFEGPEVTLYVRVAEHAGSYFIDLANDARQVVQVDQSGWRIIDDPPVAFRRPDAMRPLPEPKTGGSLDPLRPLVNLSSDADWLLFVALLTFYLRPSGPFPFMVLSGEQGSRQVHNRPDRTVASRSECGASQRRFQRRAKSDHIRQ